MLGYWLKFSLRLLFILGSVIALGLLSFSGMLLLNMPVSIAVISFFLAAVIEGEVNKQNIDQGFTKFFNNRHLEITIAKREIEELLKDEEKIKQSQFLKDYQKQSECVTKLKERDKWFDSELAEAEKKFQEMHELYLQQLYKPQSSNWYESDLANLITEDKCHELLTEIKTKSMLVKLSWVLNILAGLSNGFATATASYTFFTTCGIALSSAAIAGIVIPLSIFAAVGYTYLIYNTITDMIADNFLRKLYLDFKEFFKQDDDEDAVVFGLRVFAAVVLVGLLLAVIVFVTAATAGTWWYAVKKSADFMPFLLRVIDVIRNITVPAFTLASLLFSLQNSYETAVKFINFSFSKKFNMLKEEIKTTITQANWLQLINPFRLVIKLIEFPFRVAMFIGHIIAIGVTTDNLGSVDPVTTAAVGTVQELFTDATYFLEDDDHGECEVHEGEKHEKHEHSHDGHHHSDIPGFILKMVFTVIPLYLLAATWEWLAGILVGGKQQPTFQEVLKGYYGIKDDKEIDKSKYQLSPESKKQHILFQVDQKCESLDKSSNPFFDEKITLMKKQVYVDMRQHLAKKLDVQAENARKTVDEFLGKESSICKGRTNQQILGLQRNIFFAREPAEGNSHSDEILKDIHATLTPAAA